MDKDDDTQQDETAGKTRFPCLPSLIALQHMRNRLNTAQSGRRLMKWKALATGRELRRIAKEIALIYDSFTELVKNAFILLARCRYFYPNLNRMVVQSFPTKACVTVGRTTKSIAGCKITSFNFEDNCPDSYPCLGIDKGGETIHEAKKLWHELLRRMIQIEQLRSNFITLDIAHQNANKKANVLGKVIIPRTQVTIRYILAELEELEREEFFRLKKVLEVKYRHKKRNQQGGEPCPVCEEEEEEKRPPRPPAPKAPPPPPEAPAPAAPPAPLPSALKKSPPPKEEEPVVLPLPPRAPPTPPPMPVEQVCILCGGPMHPEGQKRKLTDEQRKQESAAIAELKEKLSKVLEATAEYEKTVKEKDSVREFKQTTEILRKTLRVPPASIPDNVDVAKLCDFCKDMYDEQVARSKCIVCGEPIAVKDVKILAAAKESKKRLQEQLDTVLSVIKDYESQGLQDEKLKEFKVTAAELKNKLIGPPIPKNVDVNRLCNNCKEQMHDEPVSGASSKAQATPKTSKVSIKEPSESSVKQTASVASNAPSSGQHSSDLPLGVFETEEITEIIQVRNPDGTVSEKRRTITIKRKQGALGSPEISSFKDKKSVGHVVVHHRKGLMERLPRDVHSEYAITSLPMVDRMVKSCISSNFGYLDEVLESITELARPALETSDGSQTTAGGAEIVKSSISSTSSPFEDDDSSDSKTLEKNSQTLIRPK